MAALANRLTELRTAAGLSMAEVADHCGVTRETVRRWERGLAEIRTDDMKIVLAKLLGVTVGQLLGCRHENCGLNGVDGC